MQVKTSLLEEHPIAVCTVVDWWCVIRSAGGNGWRSCCPDFECPYIQSRCPKRSTQLPSEPYPVCSLWKPAPRKSTQGPELIFVCPQRFYAVDFLTEVIEH